MITDEFAEEAEIELEQSIEAIQRRWRLPDKTLAFILRGIAQNYKIKAFVKEGIDDD